MKQRKNHAGTDWLKKAVACTLVLAVVASSSVLGIGGVYASDTLPYLGESARGQNQAYEHGYRSLDLKNWSPETDPFSESMRAQIPLQQRNAAFSATQANPNLNAETQMFTLAGDYGNAFFDSYSYTNEFSQYLFNFWQYTDYYGSWHGMPTKDVPESMYQDERGVTDAWKNRKFEFGTINMPNPGYTNAAHKNGVKSIGCIFLPRTGQSCDNMLQQDSSCKFPIAEKLVAMCKWYGFDGYFINQEEKITTAQVPVYKAFMKQMRDAGVYIQWYDSVVENGSVSYQNEFNSSNSPFVKDNKLGQVSDSIFLNYWWGKDKMTNSAAQAKTLGLNPLSSVFAGIEAGGDRWNRKYDLKDNLGEDGRPMNGIASLGSEFVHDGLDEDLEGGANNNVEMRREKDDYQWMTFQRERMWWTGLSQNPTTALENRRDASYKNTGIGVNGNNWDGVSAYITERSVINGDTFITNFNTGHGLEYVQDGTASNTHEWSNINIQDILPTWQWWQETSGTKLNVDFDYGTKYKKTLADKSSGTFDFMPVGAYNGGNSLVVSGKLDADSALHLYKTNLDVKASSKMQIIFKKTSDDNAAMKLRVYLEDAPTVPVDLEIANTTVKSDSWVTSSVDLSSLAGKKIAAVGLVFSGTAASYQMNIGQLKYTSSATVKPAAPANLHISKAYDTKEMKVTWDKVSYDTVKQYNVYAVINGKEMYMGGTYDNIFYIKSLYDAQGTVTIKLKAVSADGTESDAASADYDYSKAVTDVKVTPNPTTLDVSWKAPAGVTLGTTDLVVAKEYDSNTQTYKAQAVSGATSCSVTVPATDGARYTMKITPKDTSGNTLATVNYDGKLADKTAAKYTGKVVGGKLTEPEPSDWNKIYYTEITGGAEGTEKTVTRSVDAMPAISKTADSVKVVLEDYAGNKSEAVTVPNCIQVTVSPTTAKVQVSMTQQFTAQVKNYQSAAGVTWAVQGASSAETKISVDGLLTVGADETGKSIQVVATSKEDPEVSAQSNVSVQPAMVLTPDSGAVYKGETQRFTVKNLGKALEASSYTWEVSARYGNLAAGTNISESGLLTVDTSETAYTITVKATNKTNSEQVLTATVSPKDAYALQGVDYSLYKGCQHTLNLLYKGEIAPASDFTWTVSSANDTPLAAGTLMRENVLVVDSSETAQTLNLTVTKKADSSIVLKHTYYVSDPYKVTSISKLGDSVEQQTVKYGTQLKKLNLPTKLNAEVDFGYGEPSSEAVNVMWSSSPEYSATKAGKYVFTAKLAAGYVPVEGVTLPAITVTVQPSGNVRVVTSPVTALPAANNSAAKAAVEKAVSSSEKSLIVTLGKGQDKTAAVEAKSLAGQQVYLYSLNNGVLTLADSKASKVDSSGMLSLANLTGTDSTTYVLIPESEKPPVSSFCGTIEVAQGNTAAFHLQSGKPTDAGFAAGNGAASETRVFEAYKNGTAYYGAYGHGKVGQTTGMYANGVKLFEVKIVKAPYSSDTTVNITNKKQGSIYWFKVTLDNASTKVSYTAGNGKVLSTRSKGLQKDGSYLFGFQITGKAGEKSGVYANIDGKDYCVFHVMVK